MLVRRTAAVAVVIFAVAFLLLVSFLKFSIEQGKTFIQPAFNRSVLNSYVPKTGDIVVMHYLGHGMIGIPVAEHWPTHAGFVWVKPDGKAVVLECTKFSAPALPNVLEQTKKKERGVRAVPWEEYVNAIDNVLYIRELTEGTISSKDVETQVNDWAVHLDFETRIADSMTLDLTVAIGFVPVWPKFSEWCAKAAKLHELKRRKKQAFCSEFVAQLLQKVGGIDPDFKELYRVSPASLLQTAGVLDTLSLKSPRGTRWGQDRMLVRRA
jgi:hypothetical protein